MRQLFRKIGAMKNRLYNFLKDRRGNFGVIFGLVLTPIMMSVGVSVDYSMMQQARSRLQESADAAALYAFTKYRSDYEKDASAVTSEEVMKDYAEQMALSNYDLDATIDDVTLDTAAQKITVKINADFEPAFMGIVGINSVDINVESEVTYSVEIDVPICMYVTDPNDKHALELNGSSQIRSENCAMHVNSDHAEAVDLNNPTLIEVDSFCVAGGIDSNAGNIVADKVATGCAQLGDPYSGETKPSIPSCHQNSAFKPNKDTTIDATTDGTGGVYVFCGGVDMNNKTLTLNNGIFVFKNSWLEMKGNAELIGSNAVLYFIGNDVGISMTGASSADFSGRETGTLAGYSVYVDPTASISDVSKFWGSSDMDFEGIMYFADAGVEIGGSMNMNSNSTFSLIVADTLETNGSSTLDIKVDPSSVVPIPPILLGTKTLAAHLSK